MSDSFCTPYVNPRTKTLTFGAAARNGRIKTLGGMDKIIGNTIEKVVNSFLVEADKPGKRPNKR
ncbi:hypothetical protein BV337_00498 [Pseudomonas syringae pv. actinidiae]|nr:hypothetical protein BV327_01162 [Pseudomonas syringae pv. actinidiae]OSS32663.1 hypothetical protein BV337_00498 [Pseudomonas syringae pv. actinidiae]